MTAPLEGVVAYVRARTRDGIDSSDNLARRLRTLGAETPQSLTNRVTHIVFHGPDGDLRLLMERSKRARPQGVPMPFFVSLSWVQACNKERRRAIEHHHPLSRAYCKSEANTSLPETSPSRLTPAARTPGSGSAPSEKAKQGAQSGNATPSNENGTAGRKRQALLTDDEDRPSKSPKPNDLASHPAYGLTKEREKENDPEKGLEQK